MKRYKCKQNDAVIGFGFEDGEVDELQIGVVGMSSYTVIGLDDLKKALSECGYCIEEKVVLRGLITDARMSNCTLDELFNRLND